MNNDHQNPKNPNRDTTRPENPDQQDRKNNGQFEKGSDRARDAGRKGGSASRDNM